MTLRRRLWLASACVMIGIGASVLLAETAVVKTRDGATYQGEVKQNGDSVVVTIRGIDTVIPRDQIVSIQPVGSYDESFHARLSKMDPKDDVPARVALSREAFDKHRYDLAREAAESALAVDDNSREATDMLELIQSQIRLERARQQNPPGQRAADVGSTVPPPQAPQPAVERRLLSPADIETIRRKELQATDTGARIRFEGDVKKRFADSQKIPFAEFNAKPQVQQAIDILDNGDASMKDKIRVLTDPQSIADFRGQIQPLVIQNCATSNCHGGQGGGDFILYNTQAANEAVAYTNFFIMQKYQKKVPGPPGGGGVFGGGNAEKRMIDRSHGDESLLANFGLPDNIGTYNHPPVNGKPIQPIFRSKDDPRYQMVVSWMNRSLAPVEPHYDIQYTPPTGPATQPAEPATQPGNP